MRISLRQLAAILVISGYTTTVLAASSNYQSGSSTLPTNAAQETGGNLAQHTTDFGPPGATACATDTSSCNFNQLFQRIAQRLTTINTTLGSPIQATGGTVGLVAGTALIGKVGIDQTTPGVPLTVTLLPRFGANSADSVNIVSKFGANLAIDSKGQLAIGNAVSLAVPGGRGSHIAVTVTNSSAQVLAAGVAKISLGIKNESATATIACNFGGTAAANTAGDMTINPGGLLTYSLMSGGVPSEAVNCISSVASSPATFIVF